MKFLNFLFLVAIISCDKKPETFNQKSIEENCFQIVKVGKETPKKQYVEPSKEDILQNFPKHIHFVTNEHKNSFENVLKHNEIEIKKQQEYLKTNEYKIYFKKFYEELPEFEYLARNREFALAKNKYGLWLIEKTGNQKAKPYFLGLTQNAFVNYDFNAPNFTFLSENAVHLSGSIVKVTRLSSFPILPKYEVIKDDVEFSIQLAEVKKDSDQDGYNDLFEQFIGLNPTLKDSDDDGLNDFEDANPRYASVSSKFSAMYEAIVDETSPKTHYSFTEVLTDCDYFNQINPKNRKFLFYNTEEEIPIKEDVLDHFFSVKYSKISENKFYPNTYDIDYADQKGSGNISAEFINGKWKISKKTNLYFGV
ncbi:hypothetical protein [Cloacibacterium normanense]|uniref:hypothetical protein n=1 Tax=Cloacibacterium normanense TaxID=237258 RepID=UPI0035B2ACD6